MHLLCVFRDNRRSFCCALDIFSTTRGLCSGDGTFLPAFGPYNRYDLIFLVRSGRALNAAVGDFAARYAPGERWAALKLRLLQLSVTMSELERERAGWLNV